MAQRPVVVAPAVDAHVHPERRRADFPGDVPEEPAVDVVLRVGRGLVRPRERDGVPRPRQPELEPVAGPERDEEREDVGVADPEEAQRPVRRIGGREADVAVAPRRGPRRRAVLEADARRPPPPPKGRCTPVKFISPPPSSTSPAAVVRSPW